MTSRFHVRFLCVLLCLCGLVSQPLTAAPSNAPSSPAPKPLFRDPIFDGAADPVVVWNPHVQRWWMFYTNRRANVPGLSGVAWVHGTKIGIAESADGGTTWSYLGTADIELPPEIGGTEPTHWAPHVITAAEASRAPQSNPIGYFASDSASTVRQQRDDQRNLAARPPQSNPLGYFAADPVPPTPGRGDERKPAPAHPKESNPLGYFAAGTTHHMFLTVVPGVFENWQHPRTIVHLTSTDLRTWRHARPLSLASDRVIDACAFPLPNGGWRMWYNNERDRKSIYHADSPDLVTWTDHGKTSGVGERPGEGPFVFQWRNRYWMIVDLWKGLGVYRSDDLETWRAQSGDLLATPGRGADDGVNGGHACVVVDTRADRAWLFYFTHPGRAGTIKPQDKDSLDLRRSSIQVVELRERDGVLSCDRDEPTHVALGRPRQ